jgi:hypothetical protein
MCMIVGIVFHLPFCPIKTVYLVQINQLQFSVPLIDGNCHKLKCEHLFKKILAEINFHKIDP